jgi:zona occludens toxin (predicted ATPase)
MVKIIQRIADNKYLQSVENDIWVDDIKEAYEMSYREFENAKTELHNIYTSDQLKEIVNMSKSKPISEEEKRELINLLKK